MIPCIEPLESRLAPSSLADIKARVLVRFPDFNSVCQVQQAKDLTIWAHEEVALGDSGVYQIDADPAFDYYHQPLTTLTDYFDAVRAGTSPNPGKVSCGGTAQYLYLLASAYGFSAGRVGVGYSGGTDAVTLIKVTVADGTTKTGVFSAHFAGVAEFADGSLMGIRKLNALAGQGLGDQVRWEQLPTQGRPALVSAASIDSVMAGYRWWYDPAADPAITDMIAPDVYLVLVQATMDRFESVWWANRPTAEAIRELHPTWPVVYASSFAFVDWADGSEGAAFATSLPAGSVHAWSL